MSQVVDVDKIAETNPNVNLDDVREAEDLLKMLRDARGPGRGYDVVSPYEHRPFPRRADDDTPRRLAR